MMIEPGTEGRVTVPGRISCFGLFGFDATML
jgi:hypothetical protein